VLAGIVLALMSDIAAAHYDKAAAMRS